MSLQSKITNVKKKEDKLEPKNTRSCSRQDRMEI